MRETKATYPLPWRSDPVVMPDGSPWAYLEAANGELVAGLRAVPLAAAEQIVRAVNTLAEATHAG